MSFRKISWSLEAARFRFRLFQWLWNLTGTSAVVLPKWLSNFRAIQSLWHSISRLRNVVRFGGKTSYHLMNRDPGSLHYVESLESLTYALSFLAEHVSRFTFLASTRLLGTGQAVRSLTSTSAATVARDIKACLAFFTLPFFAATNLTVRHLARTRTAAILCNLESLLAFLALSFLVALNAVIRITLRLSWWFDGRLGRLNWRFRGLNRRLCGFDWRLNWRLCGLDWRLNWRLRGLDRRFNRGLCGLDRRFNRGLCGLDRRLDWGLDRRLDWGLCGLNRRLCAHRRRYNRRQNWRLNWWFHRREYLHLANLKNSGARQIHIHDSTTDWFGASHIESFTIAYRFPVPMHVTFLESWIIQILSLGWFLSTRWNRDNKTGQTIAWKIK